jgi:pSer/pThr/pTyr-binding forkhead associated (FHA) protein
MMDNKTPRLVVIDGPLCGRTFYLDEPVVSIGRLVSNDIWLVEPIVSRHHCVIRTEGDEYLIEDLNSANGTYVDGELIKVCSLKEGSLIQIGTSQFRFRLQSPEESVALSQNLISSNGERPLSASTGLG